MPSKARLSPVPHLDKEVEGLRLLAKADLVNAPAVTPEQASANRLQGRGPTTPRARFTGLLNLSDAAFDRMRAEGLFPPPLKLGRRMVRWRADCVREWLDGLPNVNKRA